MDATRKWLRRNRYPIALSASVIGAGYVVAQYALGKFTEARQRMSDDRVAKENLRRRFTQNQEDCTYTILGLLPTVTGNVLQHLPVEEITNELQARRSDKLARVGPSTTSSEIAPSDLHEDGSAAASAEGTGSFVHASRVEGLRDGSALDERGLRSDKSKLQLWEDLKISGALFLNMRLREAIANRRVAITRTITLIYTLALLSLLTRVQLNLLGRRNYLSSVVSLASPPPAGSSQISLENQDEELGADPCQDFETNRKYLTFSWWLLHRGWRRVVDEVEPAVRQAFDTVNPRDSLSFVRLSELILDVRKSVEGQTDDERRIKDWLSFMLPAQEDEPTVLRESGVMSQEQGSADYLAVSPSLRRLLDETSDIIESPTFSHILTVTLDAAFSLLVDEKIATLAYKIPSQFRPWQSSNQIPDSEMIASNQLLDDGSRVQELPDEVTAAPAMTTKSCKLATVLAIFTKQAHTVGSSGDFDGLIASNPALAEPDLSGVAMDLNAQPSIKTANEYLAATEDVKDLEAFAAVIYSSNFELEGIGAGIAQDKAAAKSGRTTLQDPSLFDFEKQEGSSLDNAWEKAVHTKH
ncbi:MAG: peroxin [Chrysothrix sp. TS-e1954]|nr:MAG: peroxin [Chrysothrix sp. TS-e1954]